MKKAFEGADIVVIPAGIPRKNYNPFLKPSTLTRNPDQASPA